MSTTPLGNEAVVMANCWPTIMVNTCEAVCGVVELSVTRTMKLYMPADVGVPASTPVLDKVNPGGSDPLSKLHE